MSTDSLDVSITNPEFQTHRLNKIGLWKVEAVKKLFDEFLLNLITVPPPGLVLIDNTKSRYFSIVKTKLEEACMFAVKAVASEPANQEGCRDINPVDRAHIGGRK